MTSAQLHENKVHIMPMKFENIHEVVELHRRFLGYSLNCRLGASHMAFLYTVMLLDPSSLILIASIEGRLAGVVSAAIDPDELKKNILSKLTIAGWIKLAAKLALNPRLLSLWYRGRNVGEPVFYGGKTIIPCLTAIAVDSSYRKAGIGKALLSGVEEFYRRNGYEAYHLDTLGNNTASREFYRRLGFIEVEQRKDNVILVKML